MMRDLCQWIVWRTEERDGKPTKVPYAPATGQRASSTAPETWACYEEAVRVAREQGYSGIGFVFTLEDDLCGVDLDGCLDPETGEIEDWAQEIIEELDSYTEISPSGTGVHVLTRGELPAGRNRKGKFEAYDQGRYFTVTGRHLAGTPKKIERRQEELQSIVGRVFGSEAPEGVNGEHQAEKVMPAAPPDFGLTDEEVLDLCRGAGNSAKFFRLYELGDVGEYDDDHSRADQALVNILAFYTQDPEQLDRLFRGSALCRQKWTGRADYRQKTIDRALRDRAETYRPPRWQSDEEKPRRARANGSGPGRNGDSPHRSRPAPGEEEPGRPVRLPEDPAFPVEALPQGCRGLIVEGAGAIGCPPDFLAMPALAALSSAIGASRVVEIKRSWREGAALFLAVVAAPGAKKTPASKAATEPVRKRQAQLAREYRKEVDAYERQMREWEVDKKLAYKDNQPAPPQPERPVMERVIADDTTVEALVGILENNPRGLLIDKDELTGWVRAMDQYKGGKGADRQHWLSIWSSKAVVVDRKSRAGEPVIIDRPWVSLFGGIQPAMLKELGGGQEDGLLDRFLFAYPQPRRTLFSESEISPEAESEYAGLYRKLLSLEMVEDEFGEPNPGIVPMHRKARERFRQIVDAMSTEVFEPGFPPRLAGVWSKLEGYLARISLVLALCRCASTGEAEQVLYEDVDAAGSLIDYFKAHARRVYAELGSTAPEDLLAGEIRDLLADHGGEWAGSATELHRLLTEREAEGLPENPDWLSRTVLATASRSEVLQAKKGWGEAGGKRGRILKLHLKNGVDSVVGVAEKPGSDNTNNANNAKSEGRRPEKVVIRGAESSSADECIHQVAGGYRLPGEHGDGECPPITCIHGYPEGRGCYSCDPDHPSRKGGGVS